MSDTLGHTPSVLRSKALTTTFPVPPPADLHELCCLCGADAVRGQHVCRPCIDQLLLEQKMDIMNLPHVPNYKPIIKLKYNGRITRK